MKRKAPVVKRQAAAVKRKPAAVKRQPPKAKRKRPAAKARRRPAKRQPRAQGPVAEVRPAPPAEWIRTPSDAEAVRQGCWVDFEAAARVRRFFEKLLRHSKGEFSGQPFKLAAWQYQDVIAPLFAWKRADGTRRFRVAWIEVPKKNGKSTLSSGLSLYLLTGDSEAGAEVYNGAVDKNQAAIVFDEAANMVASSPMLKQMLEVINSRKRIVVRQKPAWMQALSADVESKEGLNAHGVIFDEIHAQKNRRLWDTLRDAGAMRRQPLIVVITTAGAGREGIAWELHEYATRVRSGDVIDPTWFVGIWAADEKDDWTDPAVWRKANPSMDLTIREEEMAERCRQAQASTGEENNFKRRRLNLWVEQVVRWLKMDRWRANAADVTDPAAWRRERLHALARASCVGGLDLGATGDLTALALLFGNEADGYDLLPWFWAPELGSWRQNGTYRELYQAWMREGYISVTTGGERGFRDWTDYAAVRKDINTLGDRYGIEELAVDRLFQGNETVMNLAADGFNVVPFGQGFMSMAAPTKKFEELVLAGKLRHGNNPVLAWMAANASIRTDDAGNMKPVKPERNSPLKVDGIVAAIMALGRKMARPPKRQSVYAKRGVMRL